MNPSSPAEPPQLKAEYKRALDDTASAWERYLAGLLVFAGLVGLSTLLLARARGSAVTPWVPTVLGVMTFWYAAVYVVTRSGYRGSVCRWINTCIDPLIPSAIFLVDLHYAGAQFAMAGGATSLFVLVVLVAVLRLDWRLCMLSGVIVSACYTVIVLLFVRPSIPPELYTSFALEHYATVTKVTTFLVAGAIGTFAGRGMQSLFLRVTHDSIERNRLQTLFGMHVSAEVMQTLLQRGRTEEGERRTATVCFTDIRDFTRFCESRPPEEIVRYLNRYFERVCAVAARHGGVVNKFMGDGILILFGAPNRLEDDARSAYAAAREMLVLADQMRASGEFPDLRIGIGLHRGEVVAVTLGGQQRKEYTVIGDVVNTASRVQSLTKELGAPLLLTAEVRERLPDEDLVSLGAAQVKGKQMQLSLFTTREDAGSRQRVPQRVAS